MKIGPRITESRKRKRLSQAELARLVGVSQPSVSDWENDRTEPTVDNMRLLAVELGVFFEWLATGRGERDYRPEAQQQPLAEYRVEPDLPKDEMELRKIYRKLTPARQRALLEFLKKWE